MLDPLPRPSPSALILVVDDELKNIQVVGAMLLRHGHEVIAAGSGTEALEKLESVVPDLILLDVMMPGMTGFEFCQKLQERPELRDVPVIFLSATGDKNFVVDALEAGAVDYITKPFHVPELMSRVELHANRRKMHNQLSKVIDEKNRLLEVVAHDLKNPLSGIQFATTMLAENPDLPSTSRAQLVSSIGEAAQRAFEIISSLLETKSIEEAKSALVRKPLSLGAHADRAIANFQQHCKRKNIHIDVVRIGDDPSVFGDSRLLMCCIENLVSNAIKFSPADSTVTIHLQRNGKGGIFQVEDEGPGILEDEVPLLFGKFTRLSARPTHGEASTGLGLHIVHELVEAMDGHVSYHPRSEKGSMFRMSLPLVDESE
jgi:two-component system sensor histidine kinase/response regulator